MMIVTTGRRLRTSQLLLAALLPALPALAMSDGNETAPSKQIADEARAAGQSSDAASADSQLGRLDIWDDGLCEMSYYRARDQVYGKPRNYVRVILVNRQWMGSESGVKAERSHPQAVEVFKLNMAEQIPTDNYNYRFLTTVFLSRSSLAPFKLVSSSQEWCGTTFKHLRWSESGVEVKCFSYFGNEGDHTWQLEGQPLPYEALFLIAREVAAAKQPRTVSLLPPMRSSHQVEPRILEATLTPGPVQSVQVAAGKFLARRIDVAWDGIPTGFVVEDAPPYRVLRYRNGPLRGELRLTERRAYWKADWPSAYYKPGHAP